MTFFVIFFLTPLLLFLYVCIFLGPTWQVSDPSSSLAAQIMFSVIRPPVDCRRLQTMFVIVSVMLKCFEISQWFLQTDGFPSSRPFFAPASHSKTTFCVAHRNESRLQQSRRCLETGFWMKSRCSSQGEAIEFYQWTFSILRQNVVNITIDKMQYFQGWLNFKIRTW